MHHKNIFLTIVILSATACSHSMDPYNTEEDRARYNELVKQQESKAESCKLIVGKSPYSLGINDDDTIAFIKEFAALKLKFDYFSPLKSDEVMQLQFYTGATLPDETSWQEMKNKGVTEKSMTLLVQSKPQSTSKTYNSDEDTYNVKLVAESLAFSVEVAKNGTYQSFKNRCKSTLESEYGTFLRPDQDIGVMLPMGTPPPKDTDLLKDLKFKGYTTIRLVIIPKAQ